jgi:hypothetical protein
MEQQLGKDKLGQLYALLDEMIALETQDMAPEPEALDALTEEEQA